MEVFLNIWIIQNVQYTEIDWKAYMQEVEGFLNGTLNYSKLQGDTGPLVYPAGFVYIFSGLYQLTGHGQNVRLAQYIFAGLYVLTLALVFRLYCKSRKVPPFVLVLLCCCSYRVHSIYVLRLFNDPVAMLLLYAALNCFCDGWWSLGSFVFSFPCAQVVLGAPFLLHDPVAYMKGAFDLGRVFLFKWTVNWRFLPEHVFLDWRFHVGLLAMHLLLLAIFASLQWHRYLRGLQSFRGSGIGVSCQLLLLPLFCSNFIGMVVSRSLHYQFYVWYYHSLPYLAWCTALPIVYKLLVLGVLELAWNTYPATWWSSGLLHLCHWTLLGALFLNRPTDESSKKMAQRLHKIGDKQQIRKKQ
ncbi:Glycosyltransferase ALG3 [Trinorchestia longiramus]|nr:Glycosyltransferase ALG3 [Trinorchestia longiramus]